MEIKVIKDSLTKKALCNLAAEGYGEMIKAVVDLERQLLAVGGELHADAETLLLDEGSEQSHLWGINIYPAKTEAERIEFTSFINIRPRGGNRSLEIKDEILRRKIREIVSKRINWNG